MHSYNWHQAKQILDWSLWRVLLRWASLSSVNHIWKHLKASWELCSTTREHLKGAPRSGLHWRISNVETSERWKKNKSFLSSTIWPELRSICCSSLVCEVAELRNSNNMISGDDMTGKSDSTALIRQARAWKLYGINGLRWDHGYASIVSRGLVGDKYWERTNGRC